MSEPTAPAGQGRSPLVLALLVAAGVVPLLALAGVLLLRSGSPDVAVAPVPVPPAVVEQPSIVPLSTPSPAPSGSEAPETFEIFLARDPFDQLVVEDTGGDSSGGVTGPSGTPPTGAGTSGSTSSGSSSSPTPGATSAPPTVTPTPAPTPSPTATAQVGGTSVEVTDTYVDEDSRETVQVAVNGTGYDVHEGESFANGNGTVISIDAPCATLEYQDSRMTLCEGDEIRK